MPQLSREDLKALLLLSRTPGIRMTGLAEFFEQGETPSEILNRIQTEGKDSWDEALQATGKVFDTEKEISKSEELGIRLVPFGATHYPVLLKESSDPPFILYVQGEIIESDQAAVALVGTRHPSLYGQEQARRFSRKLSECGLTIVSGFARGIDRVSHESALSISYGRTLAVLGSGIDVIYPREHRNLYEEIKERGALVSEFSLGTPPLAQNFPKRNRIIAGLSLGVFVVEAHSRSGSLITAHLAAEEGREVFALPGRVDQLGSRGTHRLLKEGAALVESPEEIFDLLAPQLLSLNHPLRTDTSSQPLPGGSFGLEEAQLMKLFNEKPLNAEGIAQRLNCTIASAVSLLTRLELGGTVRKRLDGLYERVRASYT